jgi:EXLDI family protein
MPNKTIYVSENDVSLFEEAKNIAGEALSSVISRALKEYVVRNKNKAKGTQEIAVEVGSQKAEREQRFIGREVTTWQGFSDDKEWYLKATIYQTQKNNWAVYLTHICKASLLLNKKQWKESGDYLINPKHAELIVGATPRDFAGKIPTELDALLQDVSEQTEKPVEFLDI